MPIPLTVATVAAAPVAALGLLLSAGHTAPDPPAPPATSPPIPTPVVSAPWRSPLGHWHLLRPFAAPATAWSAGHRGIDLAADVGEPVFAVAGGRVAFAGTVGGRGVVTIDHGGIRSTYEPVTSAVAAGTVVRAGDVIGTVSTAAVSGGGHCRRPCLHLGARMNGTDGYWDPLSLLRGQVRLLPLTSPPSPR